MRKKVWCILSFIIHSLDLRLNTGTSLPRYYSYYPQLEAARERQIFVPKHFPNENPSSYEHKGLQHFKDVKFIRREDLHNNSVSF